MRARVDRCIQAFVFLEMSPENISVRPHCLHFIKLLELLYNFMATVYRQVGKTKSIHSRHSHQCYVRHPDNSHVGRYEHSKRLHCQEVVSRMQIRQAVRLILSGQYLIA